MDHDHAFKDLILDYPRESIEFFAASLRWKPPPGAIFRPVRQEMLKDRLPGSFLELDAPIEVVEPSGARQLVLFDFEHFQEPGAFRIVRLAKYCLDLGSLFKTTRVVPVVVLVGPGRFPKRHSLGIEGFRTLQFRFVWCHLASLPATRFVDSTNIVARLNLTNMKHARSTRIDLVAQAFAALPLFEPDVDKQRKYRDFVEQYARLDAAEQEEWRRRLPKREKAMGFIKDYMDEQEAKAIARGLAQGVAQGVAQGLAQGEAQGEARGLALGEARGVLVLLRRQITLGQLSPQGALAEVAELVASGALSPEAAAIVQQQLPSAN